MWASKNLVKHGATAHFAHRRLFLNPLEIKHLLTSPELQKKFAPNCHDMPHMPHMPCLQMSSYSKLQYCTASQWLTLEATHPYTTPEHTRHVSMDTLCIFLCIFMWQLMWHFPSNGSQRQKPLALSQYSEALCTATYNSSASRSSRNLPEFGRQHWAHCNTFKNNHQLRASQSHCDTIPSPHRYLSFGSQLKTLRLWTLCQAAGV